MRLLLILVSVACALGDPSDMRPPPIPLWPWPSHVTSGSDVAAVASTEFEWQLSTPWPAGYNDTTLRAAIARYEGYAFGAVSTVSGGRAACPRSPTRTGAASAAASPVLVGLEIVLSPTTTDTPLRMHGDEAYTLEVPRSGTAVLRANSTVGALRGLESFHQLLQLARPKAKGYTP